MAHDLKHEYKTWSYENYLKNQSKKSNKKGKKRKTFKAPDGIPQDLWDTYRHLADQADKRLVRLEELARENPDMYANVTKWAYHVAEKAIEYWDGDNPRDLPRFARNHPTTIEDIEKKTRDIIEFLESVTSTKSGIDAVYKARADKLNETFADDLTAPLTWQEWARFGVRGYWDYEDSRVSYRELIRIGSDQKMMNKILKPYKSMIGTRAFGTKSAEAEIRKELGLTRDEMNLLKKVKDTVFEEDEGIVKNHAQKFMGKHGLTYDTMFG